jgi:hypothetical protein
MVEYLLIVFEDNGWIIEKSSKLSSKEIPLSAKAITVSFNKKPFQGKILFRGTKEKCNEVAVSKLDPSRQNTTDDDLPLLKKKTSEPQNSSPFLTKSKKSLVSSSKSSSISTPSPSATGKRAASPTPRPAKKSLHMSSVRDSLKQTGLPTLLLFLVVYLIESLSLLFYFSYK